MAMAKAAAPVGRDFAPVVQREPIPLTKEERADIRKKLGVDKEEAWRVLDLIFASEAILREVFGPAHIMRAKLRILAIQVQLLQLDVNDGWKTDDSGVLSEARINAGTSERGGGSVAEITLTRDWAASDEKVRVRTLIHEAAHASKVIEAVDLFYSGGWLEAGLEGHEALLHNADSYGKAARLAQGEEVGPKKLAGPREDAERLRPILALAELKVTLARLTARSVRTSLGAWNGKRWSSVGEEISKEPTYKVALLLNLDCTTRGKDPRRDYFRLTETDEARLLVLQRLLGRLAGRLGEFDAVERGDDGARKLTVKGANIRVFGPVLELERLDLALYLAQQTTGTIDASFYEAMPGAIFWLSKIALAEETDRDPDRELHSTVDSELQ